MFKKLTQSICATLVFKTLYLMGLELLPLPPPHLQLLDHLFWIFLLKWFGSFTWDGIRVVESHLKPNNSNWYFLNVCCNEILCILKVFLKSLDCCLELWLKLNLWLKRMSPYINTHYSTCIFCQTVVLRKELSCMTSN